MILSAEPPVEGGLQRGRERSFVSICVLGCMEKKGGGVQKDME